MMAHAHNVHCHRLYFNIYADGVMGPFPTRNDADFSADMLATFPEPRRRLGPAVAVDFTVGPTQRLPGNQRDTAHLVVAGNDMAQALVDNVVQGGRVPDRLAQTIARWQTAVKRINQPRAVIR